jgi:hypothetical protein
MFLPRHALPESAAKVPMLNKHCGAARSMVQIRWLTPTSRTVHLGRKYKPVAVMGEEFQQRPQSMAAER